MGSGVAFELGGEAFEVAGCWWASGLVVDRFAEESFALLPVFVFGCSGCSGEAG